MAHFSQLFSNWFFLIMVAGIPLFGALRKVNVYDAFLDGAKESLPLLARILPYLVALIVGVGMLRASGFFDTFSHLLSPMLERFGIPAEILPLALMRPFSGGASVGLVGELVKTHGGDSFIAKLASTFLGSSETTFYVVAIYFGSVAIRKTRHAIIAGLLADLAGFIASVWICHRVFGHLL